MSEKYQNPLTSRYSSKEMSFNFSPKNTFTTWRKLWLSLAKAQEKFSSQKDVLVTKEQISELESHITVTNEDIENAKKYEKKFRHDVMAHIHAYGDKCKKAKGIIHLGATSCYIKDNCWLVLMKEGLRILQKKLLSVIFFLKQKSLEYKDLPTLGFTHFQPAQLVTVGKRCTLWLQDLIYDFKNIESKISILNESFRGVKGTTGTQASFLKLLNDDHEKVKQLDNFVTKDMGFTKSIGVCGQTYTRKIDFLIVSCLSSIAQSCYKFAGDFRLLQSMKEIEEPFLKKQVGSSAMAYKRNPMRCERICSLARFVINLLGNTSGTFSNQWFERTLDDSANRRLTIPQAFLATDGILKVVISVLNGMIVNTKVIEMHVKENLPFMATENIIMVGCKKGGDRQNLHERIRELSMLAINKVNNGEKNDLIERIEKDEVFQKLNLDFKKILNAKNFIGRCVNQVEEYIKENVDPILKKYNIKEGKVETLDV